MRIAVASQNFTTVTAHAGKSRRFLVYEVTPGRDAVEVDRLDLPKDMSMHEFKGEGPHPLDHMIAIVAGSAGEGFCARMAARGVLVAVTEQETDPAKAAATVALALAEAMGQAARRLEEHAGCGCANHGQPGCDGQGGCGGHDHDDHGHDHGHGHKHGHGHGHGGCGCGGGACH